MGYKIKILQIIYKYFLSVCGIYFYFLFKKIFYLFILERGERKKEREGNRSVASCKPLTGDLVYNPGMCPDWELNQWCFGSQPGTQSTEPHQPGPLLFLFNIYYGYFQAYRSVEQVYNQHTHIHHLDSMINILPCFSYHVSLCSLLCPPTNPS